MGAAETFFNLEEETITTTGHSKDAFANKSCVAWQYRLARSGQFDSLLSCLTTAHDIFSPASKRPRSATTSNHLSVLHSFFSFTSNCPFESLPAIPQGDNLGGNFRLHSHLRRTGALFRRTPSVPLSPTQFNPFPISPSIPIVIEHVWPKSLRPLSVPR
jgi:hypothetical protein